MSGPYGVYVDKLNGPTSLDIPLLPAPIDELAGAREKADETARAHPGVSVHVRDSGGSEVYRIDSFPKFEPTVIQGGLA